MEQRDVVFGMNMAEQSPIHHTETKLTRALRYRRISNKSENLSNQDAETLSIIARFGLTLGPKDDFTDIGSAWVKNPRLPQRDKLLSMADKGMLQGATIVTWALDRIARTDELLPIVKRLRAGGVRLVSCKEPWADTVGPMGDLMIFLAGWFADMESRRKSERTKASVAVKIAAGEPWGRPRVVLDETVLRSFRDRGWGCRKIAKAMRCATGTVYKNLQEFGLLSRNGDGKQDGD